MNEYLLRKWAKACKLRDKNTCHMCTRVGTEVHHIYPKSMFPELAYNLNNGISLCKMCHIISVHASNTWDLKNWQKFLPMFRYRMNLSHYRLFNNKYQHRFSNEETE
jgi:hypothetical protein